MEATLQLLSNLLPKLDVDAQVSRAPQRRQAVTIRDLWSQWHAVRCMQLVLACCTSSTSLAATQHQAKADSNLLLRTITATEHACTCADLLR